VTKVPPKEVDLARLAEIGAEMREHQARAKEALDPLLSERAAIWFRRLGLRDTTKTELARASGVAKQQLNGVSLEQARRRIEK
jgi:hypothetical protein